MITNTLPKSYREIIVNATKNNELKKAKNALNFPTGILMLAKYFKTKFYKLL
jgi:uncharacterized membrane protein (DUF485 family)